MQIVQSDLLEGQEYPIHTLTYMYCPPRQQLPLKKGKLRDDKSSFDVPLNSKRSLEVSAVEE
jgi:hypothetical protein